MNSAETFNQILRAVAPNNTQALENKARIASGLAVVYPENEVFFRAIESDALRQLYRILTERRNTEGDATAPSPPGGAGASSVFAALSLMENGGTCQ